MEYSCFSSYGFLAYDSEPPDAEKLYESMRAGHIDKRTGIPAIDMTPGTYHEAKIYARAMALADANASIARAANQAEALKATESIPHDERAYRLVPRPTATLEDRRAAVAARRRIPRGSRRESIYDELETILGDALIAVRPIAPEEATTWPAEPGDGPGVFARPEQPAKVVRFLDPVTTTFAEADSYSETNQSAYLAIEAVGVMTKSALGQSFTGNGRRLLRCRWYLKKTGVPTGTAVAKIYAHSGTFGTNGLPTGSALATSEALDVSTLTTSAALIAFAFTGVAQVELVDGTRYFVVIEYSSGSTGNTVDVGYDGSSPTHAGNGAEYFNGAWGGNPGNDFCFYVEATTESDVAYENWDTSQPDLRLAKGDVLCVQPENVGLAEKVTIVSVAGTGATRTLTAVFTNAHDEDCSASTGLTPIWWSDAGHYLIVVTHAAALEAELVGRVNALLTRLVKSGTTWSIVEPTSPGAPTIGPFTLDTSPLGAVTVDEIDVASSLAPIIAAIAPASVAAAGGTTTLYGHRLGEATGVKIDAASVAFAVVDAHRITVTVPALAAGTYDMTVIAPAGTTVATEILTIV